jgi:hypothetical protein
MFNTPRYGEDGLETRDTTHLQEATMLPKTTARAAGALYLVIIVTGIAGGALRATHAPSDPAFAASILMDATMALADVGVGVLLYALLRVVHPTLSMMAMAFRLAQAACIGLNLVHLVLAVRLTPDPLAQTFLSAHAIGYDLSLFFFAINCLLTGALVARSGFLPRGLGWMLAGAGGVYLVGSTLQVVAPGLGESFAPAYAITLVSELSMCVYLMTRGVRASAPRADAARTPLATAP